MNPDEIPAETTRAPGYRHDTASCTACGATEGRHLAGSAAARETVPTSLDYTNAAMGGAR